ncbi:Serine/threonine-protein kinase [Lecanora helva]
MASKQPNASSSRRPKDSTRPDMAVGTFRRLEEVGRGSFATVYKGSMSKKPGYVAIKSVDLNKLNKKLKENLYSEIHILKGLHHPHIVALIDCQETSAHIHLIMELCELGDMSYFIKKRDTLSRHDATVDMVRKYPNPAAGGLNEVVVRHFLKQLASALEFLRERNFIHRDVKPQNLLLDPSPLFYAKAKPEAVPFAAHDKSLTPMVGVESIPTLKLADFGFARSLPSTSLAETLCGSPLYMAPEILRYEKYDAKADLWSVGTVLYEMMVGKPPFRASNHVELLRKIERGEDRIKFPEEVSLSDSMKKIIRGLLKRNPVERMGFAEFFNNTVVKDDIPGLADEDRPAQLPRLDPSPVSRAKSPLRQASTGEASVPKPSKVDATATLSQSPRKLAPNNPQAVGVQQDRQIQRRPSGTPPRTVTGDLKDKRRSSEAPAAAYGTPKDASNQPRRPSMVSHATAPARQDIQQQIRRNHATDPLQRQSSRNSLPQNSPRAQERAQQQRAASEAQDARERAAQDVAFERDYVLVDKQAVQVNAFADEMAASPRVHGSNDARHDNQRGAMVRRATTQVAPNSTGGTQVAPSRAIQLASGRRADQVHHRQNSYERRRRDSGSATSAISKAINMAGNRLFSMGFSPPLNLGLGGPSPPSYSPFPAYPTNQGNLLMIEAASKSPTPLNEDSKAVFVIEESAHRSDVVYGFAEVKYKQLMPLAPSTDQGLGLRISEESEGERDSTEDDGLTMDAIVTLSEEALVLYVKALSLLARSMDIAGAWWARKNKGETTGETPSLRAQTNHTGAAAVSNRVNNVVQWVRDRFNEVLVKAEFVRLKLIEAQKQLPPEHPGHPNNHTATSSSAGMGTSADQVTLTSGVTAEKIMYDRALEMSKSAAVNELVGEDLAGCERTYVTAILLLEAVLEDDEEAPLPKKASQKDKDARGSRSEDESINGVEAEDRKAILKFVQSIRNRLAALRKKMQIIAKRNSAPNVVPPLSKSPVAPAKSPTPTIATTPPK